MEEEELNKKPTAEEISKLIRGERPEGMDFEEFRLKRKAVTQYLRRRKKGSIFYSGTTPYIKDEKKD